MEVLDSILLSIAQKNDGFQIESQSGKKLRRIGDGYVDKTTLTITLLDGTEEKEELKILNRIDESYHTGL